ncbi:MAG: PEP-CTERM sorting domain-containing protein [Moraxellaceae bacterium]|nr:PEP-CTERM sorting domain-containing protein [Moraxellaceae bacterium]
MLAQAGTISCPASISNGVTGSIACEYSTASTQDFLNTDPLTVNADAFFGFSDWIFGGKIGVNAGYSGTGTGMSGTWGIPSLDGDVMLVFKSGNGTTVVGYLLADDTFGGSWESPFENPPFLTIPNTKNVSHISVYLRDSGEIPEPAPLALLAIGLMACSLLRSRHS